MRQQVPRNAAHATVIPSSNSKDKINPGEVEMRDIDRSSECFNTVCKQRAIAALQALLGGY
jgi:hypothetical protein